MIHVTTRVSFSLPDFFLFFRLLLITPAAHLRREQLSALTMALLKAVHSISFSMQTVPPGRPFWLLCRLMSPMQATFDALPEPSPALTPSPRAPDDNGVLTHHLL